MANTQSSTLEASKSWRVLECNPRWGRGLDRPATGREVYIEIDGKWGDAGKDAALIDVAPQLLFALRCLTYIGRTDDGHIIIGPRGWEIAQKALEEAAS